jgi:putative transposase
VSSNYQTTTRRAGTGRGTPKKARSDPARAAYESTMTLPHTVRLAIADLAGEPQEGVLAFVVGAGLEALDVLLEEDATARAGPKGRHDPSRSAVRPGTDDHLLTLGGRQLVIRRPRLRSADTSTEVALPVDRWASSTELLGHKTLVRMMADLSTRHHRVGFEPSVRHGPRDRHRRHHAPAGRRGG